MAMDTERSVVVNGTRYAWPRKPLVVVCIDGGDPAYFEHGLAHGYIPNVARFMTQGFSTIAEATVPSVTCTNNMSIVTGTPASVHGISGNFYLDTATGEEIMAAFRNIWRQGNTVILVTHEADIAAHANRVVRMRDGKIESDTITRRLSPDAPVTAPSDAYTRAPGTPPPPAPPN